MTDNPSTMDIAVDQWKGHRLPDLPYAHASLEPYVDARTMTLHHDHHHAAYVSKLNSVLQPFPQLHDFDAEWLLRNPRAIPRAIRTTVHENAGGHVNHSLLWQVMTPKAGPLEPGPLSEAIDRDFGDFDRFKERFEKAAMALFGSGWVWLASARLDGGALKIYTTHGHDNPISNGHFPVLVADLWEHAYYLKHGNRRADYLDAWWAVVDWKAVSRRFESKVNA